MPSCTPYRLVPLLLGLVISLLALTATAATTTPRSLSSDGGSDCMPVIAVKCFEEVAKDLACQRSTAFRNGTGCSGRNAIDMCYTLDDALNCTSDIIDGDCSASDGQLTYDAWLRGLRSVQSHLCANNATHMKALIRPTQCWSPVQFLQCIEDSAAVHQPADLMKVQLDAATCGVIHDSHTQCVLKASSAGCGPDSTPSAAVQMALSAFLLETPCRQTCWQRPAGGGGVSGGAILAIVLLATLALVLAGVLGVVSYRTSCFRIPMARG